jgi:hypothetical protein
MRKMSAPKVWAMRRLRRILMCVSGCAMTLCAMPVVLGSTASAAPAPAAGAPSFIFAPYNVASNGVIRASFHYTMLPGSTLTDSLVLANPTPYEQAFKIWSADAYNTALSGALALRIDGYPMTQVGRWITLPTGGADYGVSPGQEVILKFAITVPPNAIPGDHVGGIEALDVTAQPGTQPGNRVLVHEGIGVPIFITVPGKRHPSAAVTVVKAVSSVPLFAFATGSSEARIGYQVQNTGNTILRGKVHVWATNLFGQTVKTFPDAVIGNLLPGQLANFPLPLWQSLPIAGPQNVHVTFSPLGAKPATGSTTFWILPWLLIILILLIILAIAGWLWRRHRWKIAAGGPEGRGTAAQVAATTDEASQAETTDDVSAQEPVPTP